MTVGSTELVHTPELEGASLLKAAIASGVPALYCLEATVTEVEDTVTWEARLGNENKH